jgi:hypothetical protein
MTLLKQTRSGVAQVVQYLASGLEFKPQYHQKKKMAPSAWSVLPSLVLQDLPKAMHGGAHIQSQHMIDEGRKS